MDRNKEVKNGRELVLAVFDSAVGEYAKPFLLKTKGEALRAWHESVNDEKSPFFKHPQDYTLFLLGYYDSQTGKFENEHTPLSLGVAVEFVQPKN